MDNSIHHGISSDASFSLNRKLSTTVHLSLFLISLLLLAFSVGAPALAQRSIIIGTGDITGAYHATGGAICRILDRSRKEHGIRCNVQSTAGSVSNLEAIRSGKINMAIVRSDWLHHAYEGSQRFGGQGRNQALRSVFSIYPEPLTVVARADSWINDFTDLAGKRVNIGPEGSNTRATMDDAMQAMGWSSGNFKEASEFGASDQIPALCVGKIDVMTFTVSHPSGSIKEAVACKAVIVPVSGGNIDTLVAGKHYYRKATIPGGMYPGTDRDIETFGAVATLVTTSDVPSELVYHVVKAVFENFEQFKRLHPAFANLRREEMMEAGVSPPLHDGARKYFAEKALR